MRTILPFLLVLTACDSGNSVPTTEFLDFRATFTEAEASSSCTDGITGAADSFAEFSAIYRVHWPEGTESSAIDLYSHPEGEAEDSFSFFAAGILEDSLEEGHFVYAGGPFSEVKTDSTLVGFEIDGRVRTSFGDLLRSGTEAYTIISSSDEGAYPVGCVFTLTWSGALLAEQGTGE